MFYWVIYDISDDRTRSKVSDKCKDYGLLRIQKSAFLGKITKNKVEMLISEISPLIKEKDKVFAVPACISCYDSKITKGHFEDVKLYKNFIILSG
ncbi:MAG: CRISPR-associated endonuclease Cas2 [Candidatus Aenigmatarchaeota archaeon]